ELELLAVLDVVDVDVAEAVLVELRARHRGRQRTAEHRDLGAQLAQDPRQRAEVVLVAVRDDDPLDVVDAVAQVAEVRQHEVDADHLGGREAQPDVDDDDRVLVLEDHHVLADLAQPAQREDAQRAGHYARAGFSSPWRSSAPRIAPCSCSSASTSGRRRPPTRWPSMLSAALTAIGFVVTDIAKPDRGQGGAQDRKSTRLNS